MIDTQRARILIVTRNLPPLVGGMERLNWHMAEELAKIADVRIIGANGSAALAPAGILVREVPLKPLWKFLLHARALARREAQAWHPAVVLAGSGLTAPLARHAARACGARTAVYVHGLDVAVNSRLYRTLWLPAIRNMDRIIANSHATAGLCRDIGAESTRIGIVHPGVDLPSEDVYPLRDEGGRAAGAGGCLPSCEEPKPSPSILLPSEKGGPPLAQYPSSSSRRKPGSSGFEGSEASESREATSFRQRHGLANRPLLLSVGRLSARKGLREFVTQCLPRVIAEKPDAMLLVVGDAPNQALHAEAQTRTSIQAAADEAGIGQNIRFLGKLSDAELLAAYRSADVHVFPIRTIPGDPEGFGMVAVEAAAHGLPTVAFATGGVVDAVAEGQSGHLVASGDYVAFASAVLQTLAARETLRSGCAAFAQHFAWPAFGAQLAVQLRLSK